MIPVWRLGRCSNGLAMVPSPFFPTVENHLIAPPLGSSLTKLFKRRSSTAWPKLESATGRARKRRRRIRIRNKLSSNREQPRQEPQPAMEPQYPPGRPWEVLYPKPYRSPLDQHHQTTKPRRSLRQLRDDFGDAWTKYASTWDYEIFRSKKDVTDEKVDELALIQKDVEKGHDSGKITASKLQSNLSQNLQIVQQDGKELLEKAKDTTGIRNKEDLRTFLSGLMELATECLKEFMAGYRQGRDQEIDNVLHTYFQEVENAKQEDEEDNESTKRRRRKPKRRILDF